MTLRDHRWLGLIVGVLFLFGGLTESRRRSDWGLIPDFLIFIGGAMAMWMAAKLFWTEDPPQWFLFVVSVGWLIVFAMSMNLMRWGVLL
jgi:predicted MFS family arabinose efflux permease